MKFLLSILGGVATGGGSLFLSLLGTVAPGLAATFGEIWLKSKQTAAAREGKQDERGAEVAGSWLATVTAANRSRAQVRKDEGAWGPLGIVTFAIGMAFAYHVWMITLDSVPWSLFGLLDPHVIGSWKVSALPGKFHEVELAVLQALFYVAPPAAAATIIAKAFRR